MSIETTYKKPKIGDPGYLKKYFSKKKYLKMTISQMSLPLSATTIYRIYSKTRTSSAAG
jgi:hypothetical protein